MSHGAVVSLHRLFVECAASVRRSFADHIPLYLCTLSFAFVTAVLVGFYGLPFQLAPAVFLLGVALSCLALIGKVLLLFGACAALKALWRMYLEGRPDRPLATLLKQLANSALAGNRVGNTVHGLIAFIPMLMMFAALKPGIARIRPFAWDETFMKLGNFIGFGRPYWAILQPILGHPPITAFLSVTYELWFPVMFGCFFWQLTRPVNDLTRSQYLLSYAFAWFFGGFVLAAVFSSAGPCFYDQVVGGPNPYGSLLHYLRETSRDWPVATVQIQDALWQSYIRGSGDIQGISAMPSMHLIVAALMALLAWRTNRALGIAFSVFAFIVLIGSIMLGWHYSADGLVGIALGFFFWKMAGQVARIWARDRELLFAKSALAPPAVSEI